MSEWDCHHEVAELRARRIVNGGIQYRMQCQNCGRSVGNAVSHEKVAVYPKEWDEQLTHRWESSVRASIESRRQAESDEWRINYARYLESSEWRERRKKALERDKHVCQGCMSARATEVHHLTYSHVGRELLFQLVSLCGACHEAAHAQHAGLKCRVA